MVRGAIVGLGKMGLSHLAILNAHPDVEVVGICDASGFLLSVLSKNTGIATYSDYQTMLDETKPDLVLIATPSKFHAPMVSAAIDRGIHVFCEKPFCLSPEDGGALVERASARGLVTQVGYHNRFVGAFQEVKRLVDAGAIGRITHVLAEAYGPVVLRPQGDTWRSKSSEGGGCLNDYAAHPINLVCWYLGEPLAVGGTMLNRVFSREIEDEVASTMYYAGGTTAQLSVNWSDESVRKMTTRVTLWGTGGRIFADRQECQVFLRETHSELPGYDQGWNVRYTTELTSPVSFYLRGEEYSAQIDHFVACVRADKPDAQYGFASAAMTDAVMAQMVADSALGPRAAEERAAMLQVGQAPSRYAERALQLRRAGRKLADRAAHARARYRASRAGNAK